MGVPPVRENRCMIEEKGMRHESARSKIVRTGMQVTKSTIGFDIVGGVEKKNYPDLVDRTHYSRIY